VADLQLHHIDPRKPFVLKTDASDYAVGAVLEQFPNIDGMPELADIKPGASIPVAFMSRKLSTGQRTRWDTRDKETYAVISALDKWSSYIMYNRVLILTDHKSLQSWYKEHVVGAGPSGRRARWHSKLNNFNIEVVHIPGVNNEVGDAMSRWAYPASQGLLDVSWHVTQEDYDEMKTQQREERETELNCPFVTHPMDDEPGPKISMVRMVPKEEFSCCAAVTRSQTAKAQEASRQAPTHNLSTQRPAHDPLVSPSSSATSAPAPTETPNAFTGGPPTSSIVHPSDSTALPKASHPDTSTRHHGGQGTSGASVSRDVNPTTPDIHASSAAMGGAGALLDMNWKKYYEECPTFSKVWVQIEADQEWPTGFRTVEEKLLKGGMWCIPKGLTGKALREHHSAAGHIGGDRLMKEATRHYTFADDSYARKLAEGIQKGCEVCQACEHPHQP
jgi:hypothetical protein